MTSGYMYVYLYQQDLLTAMLVTITFCLIFIVVYIIYKEIVK